MGGEGAPCRECKETRTHRYTVILLPGGELDLSGGGGDRDHCLLGVSDLVLDCRLLRVLLLCQSSLSDTFTKWPVWPGRPATRAGLCRPNGRKGRCSRPIAFLSVRPFFHASARAYPEEANSPKPYMCNTLTLAAGVGDAVVALHSASRKSVRSDVRGVGDGQRGQHEGK